MEQAALELVSEGLPRSDLAVFHHSGKLRLKPGHRYRIYPERQTFAAEPHDVPPKSARRPSD